MPVTDDKQANDDSAEKNYRQKYSSLKVRFESVQTEKESLQTEVRQLQRQLIEILRDNQRLILKVLEYEDVNLYPTDYDRSRGSDSQFNQEVTRTDSIVNTQRNTDETFNGNGKKRSSNGGNKQPSQRRRTGTAVTNSNLIKQISSDEFTYQPLTTKQSLNGQSISPYEFSEASPIIMKNDDEHKLDDLFGDGKVFQSNSLGKQVTAKPKAPPRPRGKGANTAAKKEPKSAPRSGGKGRNAKTNANTEKQPQLQLQPHTHQQILQPQQTISQSNQQPLSPMTIINCPPMTPTYSTGQTMGMVGHLMNPIDSMEGSGELVHLSSPQIMNGQQTDHNLSEHFQVQHQVIHHQAQHPSNHLHQQQQQQQQPQQDQSPHQLECHQSHQFIQHQHLHIPHQNNTTEPHHIISQQQVPNPQQIIQQRQQQQLQLELQQQHEHQQLQIGHMAGSPMEETNGVGSHCHWLD